MRAAQRYRTAASLAARPRLVLRREDDPGEPWSAQPEGSDAPPVRALRPIGKKYAIEDLVRGSSETAGRNLKAFFDEYVFGTKELRCSRRWLESGCAAMARRTAGRLAIRKDAAASADALAARRVLFGGAAKKTRDR